jgi:hypothetical protein
MHEVARDAQRLSGGIMMCHHLIIFTMHKLYQLYPIYKHLSSIIGLIRYFKIIIGKMTHRNKRSGKDQEKSKNREILLNGQLARATVHARARVCLSDRASSTTYAQTVARARASARARAFARTRARAPYPTKSAKGEKAVLHARASPKVARPCFILMPINRASSLPFSTHLNTIHSLTFSLFRF